MNSEEQIQWTLNKNTAIIIQEENAIENIACNMTTILWKPQYVKSLQLCCEAGCCGGIIIECSHPIAGLLSSRDAKMSHGS